MMKKRLFDCTKLAAYFLWEYTRYDNALKLWYCAQDIAGYLERNGVKSFENIESIKSKGIYDMAYIHFIRNIAYRIYIYTDNSDAIANWFAAEKLLSNYEWCVAVTDMAAIYGEE